MRGDFVRALGRNKRTVYYCLPEEDNVALVDANGNRTGEYVTIYDDAVELHANVSAAKGTADLELFGDAEAYDKVLVTTDLACPITENTVLFVDCAPSYTEITVKQKTESGSVTRLYLAPLYDYVVVKVAKSINSVSYALRKKPIDGIPVPQSSGNEQGSDGGQGD